MPEKWYCMELWRATPEMLAMSHAERIKFADEHLTVSSDGPFPEGAFTEKSPITAIESVSVMLFFAMIMGGPILLLLFLVAALFLGTWFHLALVLVVTAALALHPLPDPMPMTTARFTLSLYKYFSYRFMWVDDVKNQLDSCGGWVGAGAPHGVLPLANVLSMAAINAFTQNRFLGGSASVVLFTPFLRYLSMIGGVIAVSASSLTKASKAGSCVGIVPDGIAGIFQQNAGTGEERVALKNRMGLAKLSLRTGIPIVPAYSLGNTAVFSSWYDSYGLMEGISRKLKMSIFVFWGRYGLPIPHRTNITMLFGSPIKPAVVTESPAKDAVESMHQKILADISTVFDLHKGACGWGNRKISFV